MPTLKIIEQAHRNLKKMDKKRKGTLERYAKTKKAFDENHLQTKLDFKPHKSQKGMFKIRLLGPPDDGLRLMLKPSKDKQVYYVFQVLKHDQVK